MLDILDKSTLKVVDVESDHAIQIECGYTQKILQEQVNVEIDHTSRPAT